MSLPRIIAYIGLALLLLVAAVACYIAVNNRDWYGVLVTVAFFGVLAFFFHGLRSAARRESNSAPVDGPDLGWFGASLPVFFQGPILHTMEGLIVLFGSGVSLLFALLAWLAPSWVFLRPAESSGHVILFGMWPMVLFVFFVKLCAPHFRTRIFTSVAMLTVAGIPFFKAYH